MPFKVDYVPDVYFELKKGCIARKQVIEIEIRKFWKSMFPFFSIRYTRFQFTLYPKYPTIQYQIRFSEGQNLLESLRGGATFPFQTPFLISSPRWCKTRSVWSKVACVSGTWRFRPMARYTGILVRYVLVSLLWFVDRGDDATARVYFESVGSSCHYTLIGCFGSSFICLVKGPCIVDNPHGFDEETPLFALQHYCPPSLPHNVPLHQDGSCSL